jgi:uracil phosphoribosyltransferase
MPRVLDEERDPTVGRLLATLRSVDEQSDPQRFRHAMRTLGVLLAYEIARELDVGARTCRTPLGEKTEPVLAETPVLVTILRASLPLWDGMLDVFPTSPTMVIGAARREGRLDDPTSGLDVDLSYAALHETAGRTLIYADPMIATGSTLLKTHPRLVAKAGEPKRTWIAGVIGYRGTAERLEREIPNCRVVLASADDELDSRGYIVPGLGDAGDLVVGRRFR